MYRYDYVTWFTLEELYTEFYGQDDSPYQAGDLGEILKDNIYPVNAPIWTDYSTHELKPYLEDLWQLIYARYYNWYVDYSKITAFDQELEPTTYMCKVFLFKLVNIIVLTYDRYATILGYYTAQKANLMNQINTSNSGTVRFNDTPQNGGDFSDDEHTTNITQSTSTSTTDGNTPIMRLKEIQDNYRDAMEEWCNEFRRLFIPEEDITV